MKSIPAFFFPTTIVCIDDDPLILSAHMRLLENDFQCKCYDKVNEVKASLENYESQLNKIDFLKKIDDFECDNISLHSTIRLDISKIIEISNNKNRHNEISVLLSDFHMPVMNGLELCTLLSGHNFKKMLLTQTDNYKTAKAALNSRTIDYFANKSDTTEEIREAIKNLVLNYFCDISDSLIKTLAADNILPMKDPIFVKYFYDIIEKHLITEFYLIDANGSYLLIDNKNNKHVLIVHNNNSMDEFISLIKEYDLNNFDLIEQKQLIPFLGIQKEITDIDVKQINKYLFKSNKLNCKQPYYVHLIENIEI